MFNNANFVWQGALPLWEGVQEQYHFGLVALQAFFLVEQVYKIRLLKMIRLNVKYCKIVFGSIGTKKIQRSDCFWTITCQDQNLPSFRIFQTVVLNKEDFNLTRLIFILSIINYFHTLSEIQFKWLLVAWSLSKIGLCVR